MPTTKVHVPTNRPSLFADRVNEAKALYELARGTRHETAAWKYYDAVCTLAAIACGRSRVAMRELLAG